MDLIIHQMVKLQHIHVTHRNRVIKEFAGTAVPKAQLAAARVTGIFQQVNGVDFAGSVKYRSRDIPVFIFGSQSQMYLQDLPDVHSGRYAQRVQHDLKGLSAFQEGHVLFRKDPGDNTLVSVTSGHLVADADLTLGGNVAPNQFVDSRRQLVAVFSGEYLYVYDDSGFPMGNLQGGIPDFPGFFTEDGPQQSFFCSQLCLSLGGDFTDQDIGRVDFRTDADDSFFVQIPEGIFTDVGNIPGDFLRTQLGIPGFRFIFFNMNGGQGVFHDQPLVEDDGILVVVAFPGHEADEQVFAQGNLTQIG